MPSARLRPRQWSGVLHFWLEQCYLSVSALWGSRCAEHRPRARSERAVLFVAPTSTARCRDPVRDETKCTNVRSRGKQGGLYG